MIRVLILLVMTTTSWLTVAQVDSIWINFGNDTLSRSVWMPLDSYNIPKKVKLPNTVFIDPLGKANSKYLGLTFNAYIPNINETPITYLLDTSVSLTKLEKDQLSPSIKPLLEPFFLSKYEVTNKEYREFVKWTRDSIARELLIGSVQSVKEKSKMLCNCADSEIEKYKEGIDFIRDSCDLNWNYSFSYDDPKYTSTLSILYLPIPERFYTRPQFDVDKIRYLSDSGTLTKVYPDTVACYAVFGNVPISAMYFWHPYYNSFPVVNVSYEQIRAFCHWKAKQVNKDFKFGRLEVQIPHLYQYELAAKYTFDNIIDDEILDVSNDNFLKQERSQIDFVYYLNRVHSSNYPNRASIEPSVYDTKKHSLYSRWYLERENSQFNFLTGNVSEVCADSISPNALQYYNMMGDLISGGHFTIGENFTVRVESMTLPSYTTVFYKNILPNKASNAYTGFRLLYKWYPE